VTTTELLEALWRDYVAVTPQAARIHQLLAERGELVHNDHVALRTFGSSTATAASLGIAALAQPFEALGWVSRERYEFAEKHLHARYWQHPDPDLPKIFISEIDVTRLSPRAQAIIAGLLAQLPVGFAARPDLPWAGRPWSVRHAEYLELLAESEYAAWVAAFGFRVNHFTVDVGALSTFPDLPALVAFLVEHAFVPSSADKIFESTDARPRP
jgi:hypothetical protein